MSHHLYKTFANNLAVCPTSPPLLENTNGILLQLFIKPPPRPYRTAKYRSRTKSVQLTQLPYSTTTSQVRPLRTPPPSSSRTSSNPSSLPHSTTDVPTSPSPTSCAKTMKPSPYPTSTLRSKSVARGRVGRVEGKRWRLWR